MHWLVKRSAEISDRVLFGLNSFEDCYTVIRSNGWHYIYHRKDRYELLFNWKRDPRETDNLMVVDREATKTCRNEMTWFLKMTGPAGFLETQRSAYDAFVASVGFTGGSSGE